MRNNLGVVEVEMPLLLSISSKLVAHPRHHCGFGDGRLLFAQELLVVILFA